MALYSSLLRTAVLPWLLARDNRQSALQHWRYFEKSQYWPRQQLLDYQWQKLTVMLRHAYDTCPFYRRLYDEHGVTPDSVRDFSDLTRLPVLTRDDIVKHGKELISSKYKIEDLQTFVTGGTTGVRTELYRDQESANIKLGIQWRHEGWVGRKPCDKIFLVWPANVDIVHASSWKEAFKDRYLNRQLQYHAGSHRDEELMHVYNVAKRFNARFLKVFPSSLQTLAEFMQRANVPRLYYKSIMSTGEPLYGHQRRLFEDFFEAEVFDMYGSREVGNTACESPAHHGMLIVMETSIVEFLEENKPVPYGERGNIIITDLTNFGMPMIRYDINDKGVPLEGISPCGRELLMMDSAIGRDTDNVWTHEGVCHSGHILEYVLIDYAPDVSQIQIIQKTLFDFHFRIVNRPEPTQRLYDHIDVELRKLFGPQAKATIELVDRIPQEKSGKVRSVICELDQETIKRVAALKGGRQ